MPIVEHIDRLNAARFQWDQMGAETLLIARTDSESGKLISSTVDNRDHEFILGVVDEYAEPLAESLLAMEREGATRLELDAFEAEWLNNNELMTFDEGMMFKYSSL